MVSTQMRNPVTPVEIRMRVSMRQSHEPQLSGVRNYTFVGIRVMSCRDA
jgi:hypothetical protein